MQILIYFFQQQQQPTVKLKKRSVAPKQQVIKETAAGPAPVAKANPFGAGFSFAPSSGAAAAPLPLSSNGPGSS